MVELDLAFWKFKDHTQRVNREEWHQILMKSRDKPIINGIIRQLKAKYLGAGVYEIFLTPRKEEGEGK